MADPKGPETGKDAKGAPSARPRSPTLDLSATDVTPKPAAPKPADEKPIDPRAQKTAEPPKPAAPAEKSAPAAAASEPAKSEQPKAATVPPTGAKPEAAKPEPAKPEPAKPEPAKPEPPKPAQPSSAAPKPASAQPETSAARATVPPPSEQPAREGVGVLGLAFVALAGAGLALLGVALFGKQLIGVAQPDMGRVSAVESKIDAVGRDVGALRTALASAKPADTSAIEAKIGDLSKTVDEQNGRVGGVQTELKALSAQVAKPRPSDPAIAALTGRLEGLELRVQEAPTSKDIAMVIGRIAGIEARTKDLPSKDALADFSVRLDDLGQTVDGVGQKIGAATAPLASKVDQISAALQARPKGDPTARLVVALGALDQALGEGRPFAPELEAVKAAAGENAELAALDAQAAKGLPKREALGAELAAEIAKLTPVKPVSGSILERFVANAGGVVKITPKDGPTGSDPSARRARVAELGTAGDLEGALAARGSLDEAARAATEEWATLATARVSAEHAIRAAQTAALARLTTND